LCREKYHKAADIFKSRHEWNRDLKPFTELVDALDWLKSERVKYAAEAGVCWKSALTERIEKTFQARRWDPPSNPTISVTPVPPQLQEQIEEQIRKQEATPSPVGAAEHPEPSADQPLDEQEQYRLECGLESQESRSGKAQVDSSDVRGVAPQAKSPSPAASERVRQRTPSGADFSVDRSATVSVATSASPRPSSPVAPADPKLEEFLREQTVTQANIAATRELAQSSDPLAQWGTEEPPKGKERGSYKRFTAEPSASANPVAQARTAVKSGPPAKEGRRSPKTVTRKSN